MRACVVCGRERAPWQLMECRDGGATFVACADLLDCGPHANRQQARLDREAFAALGVDFPAYAAACGKVAP